jgi:hypothetical protein
MVSKIKHNQKHLFLPIALTHENKVMFEISSYKALDTLGYHSSF